MWKNISDLGKPQMTIRRMFVECWLTKAKNAKSEYVILIVFPLQQWSHEKTSFVRYTHIAFLVICVKI
jgi:hypothetical protein